MPGLDDLNCQIFRDLLNGVFEVQDAFGAPVVLKLIEVNEKRESPRLEQFSLTFRGPREPVLAQRIWRFEHPTLGPRDLFAVPLGPDGEGMLYEVIFNRVRRARP
ncbi:MAG: hypothetical protein ABSE42_05415 [Bryobacteraceae bacterium]|jgi:hypothetical protein